MRSTRFWNKLHRYHTEQNKRPRHVTLEIHVLVSDRHKTVARLNWLMGSQTYSLDNWSSNGNAYIKQLFCFWWWNVTMADRHDWDIQCHTHNITVWRAILLETQRTFSKDDKRVYLIWLTDSYFFWKFQLEVKTLIVHCQYLRNLTRCFHGWWREDAQYQKTVAPDIMLL